MPIPQEAHDSLRPFRCPQCGSTDLRRSLPRSLIEDVIRSLTPLHLYFCRQCEHRGWKVGALHPSQRPAEHGTGRALEPRDVAARKRRWRGVIATTILAVGLGVVTGLRIHACNQQVATPQIGE